MAFHHLNPHGPTPPSPLPASFALTTPPGTDVWRKPPALDSFDAPILYRTVELNKFRRARVTVKAGWKTLFDQGGLCFILPGEGGVNKGDRGRKWIKTGIEFTHGKPHISTVACDRWADWSLTPADGTKATVEMEREIVDGKPTSTLWVYLIEGNERRPLREVAWVFEKEEGACWVGVYAAKPMKDDGDEEGITSLEVRFEALEIEEV